MAPINPRNVSTGASNRHWIVEVTLSRPYLNNPVKNNMSDEYIKWQVWGIKLINNTTLEPNRFNACPKFWDANVIELNT